jgi:hypothetical protein
MSDESYASDGSAWCDETMDDVSYDALMGLQNEKRLETKFVNVGTACWMECV